MNDIIKDQELLLNAVIDFNKSQSFNNLFEMIKSLKCFSKSIVETDGLSISADEYKTVKSIADGHIKIYSIDTIIELSSQCCELF